ncbi:OmpA family protein [Litorisediminicola beolgyonensis]|uniref:OmpA family protein n=1 Tax=Litorisediminicola beolgyonensis TaxID=1173614 RepID=A0ABW3ZLC9_9RHOB
MAVGSYIYGTGRLAAALTALAMSVTAAPAFADTESLGAPVISTQNTRTVVVGEQYIPGIWVDPDGCEHWVMDDGVEGYMSPHVNRKGIPVCRRGNVCGVMNTDQFFATDRYAISPGGKQRLAEFFSSASATAFVIAGHTDSRASDEYNMKLSYNRANAVAKVGRSVGANIVDIRGYGERMPAASNATTEGMAKNRRVEIICIR